MKMFTETKSGKGKTFSAEMVGYVVNKDMEPDNGNVSRPIWAMFGGSEDSLRPFIANIMLGREITDQRSRSSNRFEWLRKSRTRILWQRVEGVGMLATVYQPDLFLVSPSMVDAQVRFAMLPTTDWLTPSEEVTAYVQSLTDHYEVKGQAEYIAGIAPAFAAYIEKRTPLPLYPDHFFYAHLLTRMMEHSLAVTNSSHRWGNIKQVTDDLGLLSGLFVNTIDSSVREVIGQVTREYVALRKERLTLAVG